jgi:type VI secretion system protein ImpL
MLRAVLEYLSAHLGAVFLVLFLMVIVIFTLIIFDLRRKTDAEEVDEDEGADEGETAPARSPTRLLPDDIGRSFSRALSSLRSYVPGSRYRYRIPWFAVVGPRDSGSTRVLESTGLPKRFDEPLPRGDHRGRLAWFFFDQGVFIDVAGDLVLRPDGTADEASWERFLRRLLRHRPERPLDGVVLTLSMAELMDADEDRLTRDGAEIFHRLRQAQHVLGVRFPVYVIITHCDQVRGFDALVEALPENLRQDIFGWSNPYAVEAAFSPSWLDEAFAGIRRVLSSLVTEILAQRDDVRDPDAVFRFPDRLTTVASSVRTMLTEVFRESAYHEGFFFRGLYFTGDPHVVPAGLLTAADMGDGPGDTTGSSDQEAHRLAFLQRLFQRKIVPERGLARGFTDSILGRNTTIRRIKMALLALCVVAPLSLWLGYRSVDSSADGLADVLRAMNSDLSYIGRGGPAEDEAIVLRLLTQLASVDAGGVRSIFLPSSWRNNLNARVVGSFEIGFAGVILPALRDGIILYARDSLSLVGYIQEERPSFVEAGRRPGEAVYEAEDIYGHLLEFTELVRTVQRFNALATPEGEDPLGTFIAIAEWYYIDPPLPPGFKEDFAAGSRLYEAALASIQIPLLTADSFPDLTPTALGISGLLVDSLYGRLSADITRLTESLDAVSGEEGVDLSAVRGEVTRLLDFFGAVDPYWLDEGRSTLDPEIATLLDSIPSGMLVSDPSALADEFRAVFEAGRARGLAGLAGYIQGEAGNSLRGLLRVESVPEGVALRLEPAAARLNQTLDEFMMSGFLDVPTVPPPDPVFFDEDARVVWRTVELDRAIEHLRDYRELTQTSFDSLPATLRVVVQGVADDSIAALVASAVMQARQYEQGPILAGRAGELQELGRRLATFDGAMERFRVLLAESQNTGAGRTIQNRIASSIVLEASELLQIAQGLAEAGQPWEPADGSLSAWDGTAAPAYAVYPVSNPDELEAFLAGERAALAAVADRYGRRILGYVELAPVQTLLQEDPGSFGPFTLAPIRTWQGIVRNLDDYEEQVAGNPLAELERFIREDLSTSTPATCPFENPYRPVSSDRYIEGKTARLRALFVDRCQVLALRVIKEEYDSLASFFNRRVRGRFPFVAAERAHEAQDVEPAVMRDLFVRYDHLSGLLSGQAVRALGRAPGGAGAEIFLVELGRARQLIAPLLDEEADPVARAVPYRIDFRTDREREVRGEEIVDWRVVIDGQSANYGEDSGRRSGEWRLGARASLSLTWASESTYRPAWGSGTGVVQGKSIAWAYVGPWALLRMIVDHRERGEEGSTAPPLRGGGVLNLRVTTAGPDGVAGPESSVFLEIVFSGPTGVGDREVPVFPREAPALPTGDVRR